MVYILEIRNRIKNIITDRALETSYLVGVFLYTFLYCYVQASSELIVFPDFVDTMLFVLSFVLTFPKVILQDNKKELIFAGILYSLCLICIIASGKELLIIIPTILVGMKNSKPKTIANIVFIISASYVLITGGVYIVQTSLSKGFSELFSLTKGEDVSHVLMANHNDFASRVVSAVICYTYLTDFNKNRYFKGFVLFTISIFVYALCQSRSGFVILLMLSAYPFVKDIPILKKNIKYIGLFTLFVAISLSFITIYADLSKPSMQLLDKIFNLRVLYATENYKKYGVSFFFPMLKNKELINLWSDSIIIEYIFKWGILFCVVLLALVIYLGFIVNNNVYNSYLLTTMLAYSIIERFPRKITMSLIPLLLMYNFFESNKKYENK